MIDKELLEFAAKAAGYVSEWKFLDPLNGRVQGWYLVLGDGRTIFDPLTDDGDAFRLAVKCLPFHVLQFTSEDYEHCNQDGRAATRRAIVRAAAEIGKGIGPM